eukprot:TRINITY_DN7141_c0_g1_i1.p1 TRINITY_DN7141_c0_g1~~TRINITY_DN7141_c0_g1_i1.p1  ORF type:complete len:688 (+),score=171.41 TRINITY_DN7141_c0_g1_i1:71-2134(+)
MAPIEERGCVPDLSNAPEAGATTGKSDKHLPVRSDDAEATSDDAEEVFDAAAFAKNVTCSCEEDVVRLAFPGDDVVEASKRLLAVRTAFFAPLADEAGPAAYGDAELKHLVATLAPGAIAALPAVLRVLGCTESPPAWEQLLQSDGGASLFHVFAVAHLLGATELLDRARDWAAADEKRLAAAIDALHCKADGVSLRMAMDYGLDQSCSCRLVHAAAAADAAAAVKILIAEGAAGDGGDIESPVDFRDSQGRTPLHICALHDSAAAASHLIYASAAVDALCDPPDSWEEGGENEVSDASGQPDHFREGQQKGPPGIRTALHLAAEHDSVEVAQLLLDAKANVAACLSGQPQAVTPLHECAASDSVGVARLLAAAARGIWESQGSKIIATAATADGSDKNVSGLPLADSEKADVAMVGAMGECDGEAENADVPKWACFLDPLNAKVGINGTTPLHVAAESDSPGVVRALMEAKADVTEGDDQGDTPVHCAVLYGAPQALAALFAAGASAMCENNGGELPLHQLAEFGTGDLEEACPPAMLRRHFARSLRTQEILIDELRNRGQLGEAVGHRAANDLNNTPLHSIVRNNHIGSVNAVRLLASAKADLEAKNAEGKTPLTIALRREKNGGEVGAALRALGASEPVVSEESALAGAMGGCLRPLTMLPVPSTEGAAQVEGNRSAEAVGEPA